MQKPSPCRFVLFCFRDRATKQLVERPALITSVNPTHDLAVNLHVFFEQSDEDECSRGCSGDWGHDPRYEVVCYNALDELKAGSWRWPPRVG